MKLLPIATYKDPIVRTKAKDVTDVSTSQTQSFIDDMVFTMYEKDGVGLAATQVRKSVRIAVIAADPNNFDKLNTSTREALILVNPVITSHSLFRNSGEEGCLSVPDVFGMVKRWNKVTVTYQDRHGEKKTIKAAGLMSRVLQHEIDHLDGILFIEKADKLFTLKPL